MTAKTWKSFSKTAEELNLKAKGYKERLNNLPLENIIADYITEKRGKYIGPEHFKEETIFLIEELKLEIEELYMK